MSVKKSKNILGLFSILIMMHHLGQKTSAEWVPAIVRQHGLEVFVPIGYLLVSFFFFCSGYGLIKSMRTKEDYFKGFLVKRLNRVLMAFIITEVIYLIVRIVNDVTELPLNPYSWFIYTIIILYIGFFMIYRKENKSSFLLMAVWILAYSVICYILIKGNWWMNATPVFLFGIYIADHEDKIKKKIPMIIVSGVIFVVTFFLAENRDAIYRALKISDYGIINIATIILQIAACSCFSLVIYLFASLKPDPEKENVISKFLSFYGSMTLEFYLIHGLFVQMFGHHFMNDSTAPIYYIKNVFVYVIVVFALATASAFVLKKIGDFLSGMYKKSDVFKKFCKDQKRNAIIVCAIFLVITIGYSAHRHQLSADAKKNLEKYEKENIKHVNVNGTDVAVYDAGEGEYTVVLLGADDNPCPTLYLRPLANKLTDSYRVVIIDYPGKGYSGESDAERTTEYFADITHETLSQLGVTENIVLVPNFLSSIYTYRYIEKYPGEVAGFVGLDAVMPEIAEHVLEGNYNSVDEYRWYIRRITRLQKIEQKIMTATGYVKLQTPLYEYVFQGSGLKDYYPVMEEMHVRRYMQSAHLNERKNIYDNCESVAGYHLPDNLPAEFLLDNYVKSTNIYGVDWAKQYGKMITNKEIQSVEIISGNPYVIYYNPDIIAKKIDELLQ